MASLEEMLAAGVAAVTIAVVVIAILVYLGSREEVCREEAGYSGASARAFSKLS
ncbi:MAG: hypothetical protein QXS85_04875 [Acidilobaceae archaeon]